MEYLPDKEQLERFEFYTMQLEEQLLEGEDIETISEQVPFAVSLNDPDNFELFYTNKAHEKLSGYSVEEIREKWPEYLKIVHPDSIKSILSFLPAFYKSGEPRQTMAFAQHVKLYRDSVYSPVISFTKPTQLPSGLVLWLSVLPEDFGKQSKQMEQIVKMDEFKMKHFRQFQQLTDREAEILRLLANGYNNRQIADQLFLSRQTVETHRKHIKKKLEIRTFRDLVKYAFAFNFIEF